MSRTISTRAIVAWRKQTPADRTPQCSVRHSHTQLDSLPSEQQSHAPMLEGLAGHPALGERPCLVDLPLPLWSLFW
jgi:hypothetical protein